MYTDLGKFLRHLRIEKEEILMDMSKKLDVSAAFLSSIEHGKKNLPNNVKKRLIEIYDLNANQITDLENAIELSSSTLEINLQNISKEKQKVGILFARTLEDLDEDIIVKIRSLIKGESS